MVLPFGVVQLPPPIDGVVNAGKDIAGSIGGAVDAVQGGIEGVTGAAEGLVGTAKGALRQSVGFLGQAFESLKACNPFADLKYPTCCNNFWRHNTN